MGRRTLLHLALSLVLIALIAGGAWWGVVHRRGSIPPAPTFAEEVAQARQDNAAALSSEAAAAASRAAAAQFAHTYQGPGFSFGYPDALKVGATDDPTTGATTILAQDAASHVGIQITISSDPGVPVTQAQVQNDLPQIAAHDFTPVALDGAPGIAFSATDPNFGDSLQVWLTRGGQLYQISTYATQGPLLSKMLGTWQWQ